MFHCLFVMCLSETDVCKQSCRSLAALFHTLGGHHWRSNTNWQSTSASYCSFFGVTCDAAGHPTFMYVKGVPGLLEFGMYS